MPGRMPGPGGWGSVLANFADLTRGRARGAASGRLRGIPSRGDRAGPPESRDDVRHARAGARARLAAAGGAHRPGGLRPVRPRPRARAPHGGDRSRARPVTGGSGRGRRDAPAPGEDLGGGARPPGGGARARGGAVRVSRTPRGAPRRARSAAARGADPGHGGLDAVRGSRGPRRPAIQDRRGRGALRTAGGRGARAGRNPRRADARGTVLLHGGHRRARAPPDRGGGRRRAEAIARRLAGEAPRDAGHARPARQRRAGRGAPHRGTRARAVDGGARGPGTPVVQPRDPSGTLGGPRPRGRGGRGGDGARSRGTRSPPARAAWSSTRRGRRGSRRRSRRRG